MNNSKQLTQEQLTSPVVLEKIRKLAQPIIWHMQTKEAYNLALNLEKSLESADLKNIEPKLAQEYQDLINKLKLTALPMLDDEETVEIINRHFLDGLQANLEMENRLTAKLFSLPLTPRDEFRQQLQKAIRNNKQRIGPWSIEEWLVDYNNFTAPEKRTNISPREYLIQSRQTATLSEEDKNKLYTLFHIYDHLLLVTPVVSEEELGQIIGPARRSPALKKVIPPVTRPILPVSPGPPSGQPVSALPAQPIPPRPAPPLPPESVRPAPARRDIYQEPIEESLRPTQVEPKIKGNIVDLKNQ
jgi:hypothetical protein